jgi:hypothetical protein
MDQILKLFVILFSVIGVETLMLIFIMIKTPAMPFLSAFLTKKPIMYIMGKDKIGKFLPFKRQYGAGVVKKLGIFDLTENSHTLENNTKTPIYFAFEDFAATLTPEYPAIIQELRGQGYKVTRMEDVERLINEIKLNKHKEIKIDIKPYKTYKLHDLENMFPLNITPTFVEAQVQGELNKFSRMMKAGPALLGGIVILVMVSAVAVFILQKAFKGSMSPEDCELMVSAAKCAANGASTITTGAPIIP